MPSQSFHFVTKNTNISFLNRCTFSSLNLLVDSTNPLISIASFIYLLIYYYFKFSPWPSHFSQVWDVERGYCTHRFTGHTDLVVHVRFLEHSPAGQMLLVSGSEDNTARVWDLKSKKSLSVLRNHMGPVTSSAQSEDGRYIYTGGRDQV
jgi:hypothetical protein